MDLKEREAPPTGLEEGGIAIRSCMGSHRRLPREGRGGVVVEEGVVASPVEEGVAAATVEERRGRQIWGQRAAKLLGAAGGRSGGGGRRRT